MEHKSVKSIIGQFEKPIKSVNPFLKEFRDFAMHGNVIDLAVGVIIGAAFGKIVDSLVTNVIMPPLSVLTGGIDLSHRAIILSEKHYASIDAARAAKEPILTYGLFLDAVISFILISFTIFLCVRMINRFHRKPAPQTKDCIYCVTSIPLAATRCPHCTSQLG